MTGPTSDGLDAAMVDAILDRLPAAMAQACGHAGPDLFAPRRIDLAGLTMVPLDPPALEAIDVTWPDGTYKVFPDEAWVDIMPDLGEYGRQVTRDIVGGLSAPVPDRAERCRMERAHRPDCINE